MYWNIFRAARGLFLMTINKNELWFLKISALRAAFFSRNPYEKWTITAQFSNFPKYSTSWGVRVLALSPTNLYSHLVRSSSRIQVRNPTHRRREFLMFMDFRNSRGGRNSLGGAYRRGRRATLWGGSTPWGEGVSGSENQLFGVNTIQKLENEISN